MRDLVIGVTVLLPDGLRASSGGKVVKNVAGYDLGKLFCGSRGRLGRVERVALRLHPLPAAARTVVLDGDRWQELHNSYLVPSAVDLANGKTYVLFEGLSGLRRPLRRPRSAARRRTPGPSCVSCRPGSPGPRPLGRRAGATWSGRGPRVAYRA